MAKNKDFIGFTFNGRHSSEFNIYSVSDGSRYQDSLVPSPIDYAEQIPGGVGQSYFGSDIDIKEFPLSIAYDKLTEIQVRELRNWLAPDAIGELIFDERPYKTYTAKISASPSLSFICFDRYNKESGKKERVYKGEGSINFVCYYPLGIVSGEKKELNWYREQIDDKIYRSIGGNSSTLSYELKDKEITVLEKIKGKTIETGTGEKGPDNPYTLAGVKPTTLTVCGKNLLDQAAPRYGVVYSSATPYVISLTPLDDGAFPLSTNQASRGYGYLLPCRAGTIYTAQIANGRSTDAVLIGEYTTREAATDRTNCLGRAGSQGGVTRQCTYTAQGDGVLLVQIASVWRAGEDVTYTFTGTEDAQLETGSTVTGYEPYQGQTVMLPELDPLYGNEEAADEYDAATGIQTRRWKRLELDGTENWLITMGEFATAESAMFRISGVYDGLTPVGIGTEGPAVCTHLPTQTGLELRNNGAIGIAVWDSASLGLIFRPPYTTVEDWKAYLAAQKAAGTPVTVAYQLATPVVTKIEEVSLSSLVSSMNDSNLIMNINPEYFNYFTDSIANISLRIYGAKYANVDEWAVSTGMLEDLSSPIQYNKFDSETGRYGAKLYNPGDKETGFKIIFRKTDSELSEQKFWLENSISTIPNEDSKNSFTISARSTSTEENTKLYGTVSEEEKFVANTAGYIEINTNNNTITFTYIDVDNEQKTIPAYFLLKKGFMFKIPITTTGMMYANTEGISELKIDYDYLYY